MQAWMSQMFSITSIGIKSLRYRFWGAATTILSVAVVISILLAFLAMSAGFKETLNASGSDNVIVVTRAGSQSEISSVLTTADVDIIYGAPGISLKDGKPVISTEVLVSVEAEKKKVGEFSTVSLRGMSLEGIRLRESATIVEGRIFEPGKNELVVGKAVTYEYANFQLGQEIRFGNSVWRIVGFFDSKGSVFESELWTSTTALQSQFNRQEGLQSLRVSVNSSQEFEKLKLFAENEKRLNIDLVTEKEYYARLAEKTINVIFLVGWPLAILMAFGAIAGALNVMYRSVVSRRSDIALLKTLGFDGSAMFVSVFIESLLSALLGGILGSALAYLCFNGLSTSTQGSGYTQIIFDFVVTFESVLSGIFLAIIIGALGGATPGIRAARIRVSQVFAGR